jgi:hypothetical protein
MFDPVAHSQPIVGHLNLVALEVSGEFLIGGTHECAGSNRSSVSDLVNRSDLIPNSQVLAWQPCMSIKVVDGKRVPPWVVGNQQRGQEVQ